MIDLSTAKELLDFGSRIGSGPRADEQLEGAVAVHNILEKHRVAYLADEVGMGKTYVALGALALFRHYQPGFRVLVLAPRENIQRKWMKEFRNFVANNVRFSDLRVRGVDGQPTRELVRCDNLTGLVKEAALNPDRDLFCRLSSFSLPLSGEDAGQSPEAKRLRDQLSEHFPWLTAEMFDLRDRKGFKDNAARAICCVLPVFDLVIVDEAHNLKHGFTPDGSARNRVLGLAFGHPADAPDRRLFRRYGIRARRVMFLSATPIEDSYGQLWNQLDLFGAGAPFAEIKQDDVSEDRKKEIVSQFLIRRVTEMRVHGEALTRNLYRQEWRNGGVKAHDEPIRIEDDRQRLTVALVQKKVSEVLQGQRFNNSFQIGMLASFESFLETAKLKRSEADSGNFDGMEQTDDLDQREGVDIADLNRLARSHRERFSTELPHPKMDALVEQLAHAWRKGEKALVFVRRVASVREIKRKLDAEYDRWLLELLHNELPPATQRRLKLAEERYQRDRLKLLNLGGDDPTAPQRSAVDDHGGTDTFFAWFLRGAPPMRILAGSHIRDRHAMPDSMAFEENHVAHVLGCEPEAVVGRMGEVLGVNVETLRSELQQRSCRFLRPVKKLTRGDRFESVQAAAIEWLKNVEGPHQELAVVVWHERFESMRPTVHAQEAPHIADWLEAKTFFTELRRRPTLCHRLWPEPRASGTVAAFREREIRARLLAAALRLGHAFIDLYVVTIRRLGSLRLRTEESGLDAGGSTLSLAVLDLLDRLEAQMNQPLSSRDWAGFDELAEIAANFDLILDVNAPDVRSLTLSEVSRRFGNLLSRQQPVGGMAAQVNQTLVGQFRMPGYPLVLVSTDLLQEGEDLHTFCSSIHHYGISWTPSSMEQRVGRIDRVRSQTDRRLSQLSRPVEGGDKLDVYFPHLQDTVEVVQVRRVLTRMNTFLRLMHEGLTQEEASDSGVSLSHELQAPTRPVPQLTGRLCSAFQIREEHLCGEVKDLAVPAGMVDGLRNRFDALARAALPGLHITWERTDKPGQHFGTVHFGDRQQPFTLILRSAAGRTLIRCLSPVGRVFGAVDANRVQSEVSRHAHRVGAIAADRELTYDLTVEEDIVVLADPSSFADRVAWLIQRVTLAADDIEQAQLPGSDAPLSRFRDDLAKEAAHGD